ncbi:hypothetical protein D9753_06195 [Streptomyces dangxiongensis]|uniref:UL36 very large tegument protein n=1 Tax=Streptomyces dangxiongensis TaxID=1442032 RepID=A0A3G2JQX7_9ACTN|nr:hypothetical protein D9753_06195 [Streptomyces dangxiongensis]
MDRLPGRVREFASFLDALLARLGQGGGWSAVFWHRDPEGMRACLDGREIPPWDVVEALLEDLGAAYGPAFATAERERAHALHAAAITAYDTRPGARDVLADRLDVMLREQRYAAERHAELTRLLSAPVSGARAETLRLDLAQARDDHERATARCAELRARMAELDRPTAHPSPGRSPGPADVEDSPRTTPPARPLSPGAVSAGAPWYPSEAPGAPGMPTSVAPLAPTAPTPPAAALSRKSRRRRRGGARFAGMGEGEAQAPVVVPQASVPDAGAGGRTPRGARFAGAGEAAVAVPVAAAVVDEGAWEAVAGAVERLARLRAEGRSGEAHVLLAEAAWWPAGRLPPLADALDRAGLGADWATLLWEAASLPVERLVTAADALAAAGRDADARQMLRQGVARPAEQIGAAVLRLEEEGRHREAWALLDACVRVRTPEEAARCAAAGPGRLVPLLLRAALGVSDERHWDLVHALRVAGHGP